MVVGWVFLGIIFGSYCKIKYKDKFADHVYFVKTIEIQQEEYEAGDETVM